TALLDSLKLALTDLFDNTDHTVPQSTLPNRTMPSYKPLTVNREQSTVSARPDGDESGSESENGSNQERMQSTLAKAKPPTGSGKTKASNLIESWAGRDSELRKPTPVGTRTPITESKSRSGEKDVSRKPTLESQSDSEIASPEMSVDVSVGSGRSETNAMLPSNRVTDDDYGRLVATSRQALRETDPMSTPYDDLFSQRPSKTVGVAGNESVDGELSGHQHDEDGDTLEQEDMQTDAVTCHSNETAVNAIATSAAKTTTGPVPNAFDRMRPQRTPSQVAEITIGDQTTSTVLGGSPAYKKRRVHEPANSQAIAAFGCSPLLARGLRNFAASGSQMQIDSSDMPLLSARQGPGDESDVKGDDEDDDEESDAASVPPLSKTNVSASKVSETVTTATPVSLRRDRIEKQSHVSKELPTSDALDALEASPADDDAWDEDYIDENEKRLLEDEKIARMIQELEEHAAKPSIHNLARASKVTAGSALKDMTLQLECQCHVSIDDVACDSSAALVVHDDGHTVPGQRDNNAVVKGELDDTQAEDKLSLIVSKADFGRMRVVGQFNLGFILAVRPAANAEEQDELFIIDQHAADEKYNYERFQRTVTLQSQRLVRPKNLDLTAVEQEVVLNHSDALKANGFEIETTSAESSDADDSFTRTCRLLTLPTSQSTTFDLSDLSELLYLLSEAPMGTNHVPRPRKVQRMLAMRACRSSIMVGKTLTMKQMEKVVKHMGEMEKPWNCPHGRPTMRHLAGLKEWAGWREGDVVSPDEEDEPVAERTDWKTWLAERR
ncbi:ATP-binding mismatch repair protein, partial [Oleoguttula sp. CCFEE 5521]